MRAIFLSLSLILAATSTFGQKTDANLPYWKVVSPVDAANVPAIYLTEWKKADNAAGCAPLLLFGAEKEKGIKLRAATFHGGWAVAYDVPGQRSAFGIAGTGVEANDGHYRFPNSIEWGDGSYVSYGREGGGAENANGTGKYLAYLKVAGQTCLYNIWSERGKRHLEALINSLRIIDLSTGKHRAVFIGSKRWTDGLVEYGKFEGDASDFAEGNYTDFKYVIDDASVTFLGGTLHEGGWSLQIRFDGPTPMTVAGDGGMNFTTGDRVEYRQIAGEEMLFFYDGQTSSVKWVLKAMPPNSDFYDWITGDYLRYVMAGTYRRPDGETHVFSPDKPCVTGFFTSDCDSYYFGEEYDTPSLIMVLSETEAFGVKKTLTGLTLTPVQKNNCDRWPEKENTPGLSLTKTADKFNEYTGCEVHGRFPLCSGQVMTIQALLLYAGEPVDGNLKLMRNEIFARHGYRFKTGDLKQYFGSFDWYKPQFDDITDRLTEIERINIALIRKLESQEF
jgi:hypothetical protein